MEERRTRADLIPGSNTAVKRETVSQARGRVASILEEQSTKFVKVEAVRSVFHAVKNDFFARIAGLSDEYQGL